MKLRYNIHNRRVSQNMTLEDLAKLVGPSKQTIQRYESGVIGNIPSDKIEKLAEALKCSPADLMGWNDDKNDYLVVDGLQRVPEMKRIPLLGTIACGEPILAQENIEEYVPCPTFLNADFSLRCKGDSMVNARIFDGDIVCIRSQPDVENGEIAAVLIGDDATLKRVYKYQNKLVLNPENPAYEPLVYTGLELNDVRILGKAIYFISTIR